MGSSWHATSDKEVAVIADRLGARRHGGRRGWRPDLHIPRAPSVGLCDSVQKESREPGLTVAVVARIAPIKNLDGALRVLKQVRSTVTYNIFGPLEDQKHWRLCKRLIDELPDNITVNYHGSIPHRDIPDMLSLADMFFLPTHGENFGHTILEALLASCPPLISDRTPWDEPRGRRSRLGRTP